MAEAILIDSLPARVDLSIVVVTWNSERWIDRCLRAIPAACGAIQHEVILYDNASSDRTLSVAQALLPAHILESKSNDGLAAATNRAIRASRGRYVFLLNPDCELEPNSLATLIEFLDSHPDVAAAAPLLSDADGRSQRDFQLRRLPTLLSFAAEILAFDKLMPKNRVTRKYRYRDLDLSVPQRVDQPAAAALLVRREVFDEIGPLDEQFSPAWFEDVDYCRRFAAAGKSLYVVPAASARHSGGASLEHVSFARFVDLWYGNMWRYARKWFSPARAEALRWLIIVGMLLRLPAALAGVAHAETGRRDALRAYVGVLRKAFRRWDDSSASS
jgi:N-acetylglucosaminyl-diphospho-decaprenol L-rhamnosyltransferase